MSLSSNALSTVVVAATASPPSWTDVLSAWGAIVSAVAALATCGVAIVAATYAKRQVDGLRDQLSEARTARREQAQPYVVVYAEPNPVNHHFIDLVIRNMGTTGASDVRLSCTPELMRSSSGGGTEPVLFPDATPFLAPGQEWRTFWDFGPERAHVELPDRYEFTATYKDFLGEDHTTESVLDYGLFRQRMWTDEKTVHDAAKSLDAIGKTLKAWAQADRVVKVATYDGAAYEASVAQKREEGRSTAAALSARLLGQRSAHAGGGDAQEG